MLAELDLPYKQLELLRFGENLTYRVDKCCVVRVRRPTLVPNAAQYELQVARLLEALRYPAVRAHPRFAGPYASELGEVTIWSYLAGRSGTHEDYGALGWLLRTLHALPLDSEREAVVEWAPLDKVSYRVHRLRSSPAVPGWVLDYLYETVDLVRGQLEQQEFRLQSEYVLLHGDAYPENVLISAQGEAAFADLESVCQGPPDWDLSETVSGKKRFGLNERAWEQFVEAYGEDPLDRPLWPTMLKVRELASVSWLLQLAESSSAARQEGITRVRTMIDDDYATVWSAF